MGGMAELYVAQQAEVRAASGRDSRMGGMAELHRRQASVAPGTTR